MNASWIGFYQPKSNGVFGSHLCIAEIACILLRCDLHRQHDLAGGYSELHSLEVLVRLISLKRRDFLLSGSLFPYEELVSGARWHGFIHRAEGRNRLCSELDTASPIHFTLSCRPDQVLRRLLMWGEVHESSFALESRLHGSAETILTRRMKIYWEKCIHNKSHFSFPYWIEKNKQHNESFNRISQTDWSVQRIHQSESWTESIRHFTS